MTQATNLSGDLPEHYRRILNLLRTNGIKGEAELETLPLMISSDHYSWVQPLFEEVDSFYVPAAMRLKTEASTRILVPERRGRFTNKPRRFELVDPNLDQTAVLGCLFSGRVAFSSLEFQTNGSRYLIPRDFVVAMLKLDPLLTSGFASLLPIAVELYSKSGMGSIYPLPYRDEGNWWNHSDDLLKVEQDGNDRSSLISQFAARPAEQNAYQMVTTPCMRNCRLEDFVEIASEYDQEFQLYSSTMLQFLAGNHEGIEAVSAWAENTRQACLRLDIAFKLKQEELRRKGREVVAGLFCTVGSLYLPHIAHEISALVGAKSVFDGVSWIESYRSASSTLRADPFWVLWKSRLSR